MVGLASYESHEDAIASIVPKILDLRRCQEAKIFPQVRQRVLKSPAVSPIIAGLFQDFLNHADECILAAVEFGLQCCHQTRGIELGMLNPDAHAIGDLERKGLTVPPQVLGRVHRTLF